MLLILGVAPATAGLADRAGHTFGLMADDFIQAFQPREGVVVQVDGETVYLDLGADAAQVGQEFTIFRKGDVLTHPLTGKPLGRYEDVLGHAQVKRVTARFSEATFIPAPGKPRPVPEDGAVQLQVTVHAADDQGVRSVSVHSRPADSDPDLPWTHHAAGLLSTTPATARHCARNTVSMRSCYRCPTTKRSRTPCTPRWTGKIEPARGCARRTVVTKDSVVAVSAPVRVLRGLQLRSHNCFHDPPRLHSRQRLIRLVQRVLAQEPAERRNPWVLAELECGPAHLVAI